MSEDGYEELHHGAPFIAHMTAGALAGITEHCVMFPVDTIKTRRQVAPQPPLEPCSGCERTGTEKPSTSGSGRAPAPSRPALAQAHLARAVGEAGLHARAGTVPLNVVEAESMTVGGILATEGLRGITKLYRGVGAAAVGAGPAHAVYFSVYEAVKSAMVAEGAEDQAHPLQAAAASACATIVSDGMMTPADVVKQRMQMCNSPYKNMWDCAMNLLRREGASVFFRSYGTTLLMNIPFTAVNFGVYDTCKSAMFGHSDLLPPVGVHVVSGAIAGGCAAAATTPLDVVKTRLQTDSVARRPMAVVRMLLHEGGPRSLFVGMGPRVMFHMPAVAICWATYEAVKSVLLLSGLGGSSS